MMEINHFKFVADLKKKTERVPVLHLPEAGVHTRSPSGVLSQVFKPVPGREGTRARCSPSNFPEDLPRHTVRTRNLSDACLFLLSFLSPRLNNIPPDLISDHQIR